MYESSGIEIIITLVLSLQTQDIYMSMLTFQNVIAMHESNGIDIIITLVLSLQTQDVYMSILIF